MPGSLLGGWMTPVLPAGATGRAGTVAGEGGVGVAALGWTLGEGATVGAVPRTVVAPALLVWRGAVDQVPTQWACA